MGHGGGGRLTQQLIREVFLTAFGSTVQSTRDAAIVQLHGHRQAFTTDAFVVSPLFFPGGSIGDLAVNGTVNDLAMVGGIPRYLSASFVIEEGLLISELKQIAHDMAAAAAKAGVSIVTGDTKVVERGCGDGLSITTSGLAEIPPGLSLTASAVTPGDVVLLSGTIADHGMAILRVRENLGFQAEITSDTAALHGLVAEILACCPRTRLLRDPTRGGLATCLAEIAEHAQQGLSIEEAGVPIDPAVASACELLGLDPWVVANEGKLVAIVPAAHAADVLQVMRDHPHGQQSALIGRVVDDHPGRVVAETPWGGRRIVPLPVGELLPRIC